MPAQPLRILREGMMTMTKRVRNSAAGVIVAAGIVWPQLGAHAQTPLKYVVDPAWPKPFPNRWVIGGLGGVCVDAQDHVLILHRQDGLDAGLNAGHLAPPIIDLDGSG